jgi:hypothetical protein
MRPGVERGHPLRHVRQPRNLRQLVRLLCRDLRAARRPPQDPLVERDLQVQGSGGPPDERLPRYPDMNAAADFLIVDVRVAGLDHGPRVGLASAGCRGPALARTGSAVRRPFPGRCRRRTPWDHVAVGVSAAACLGLSGQAHQGLGQVGGRAVGDLQRQAADIPGSGLCFGVTVISSAAHPPRQYRYRCDLLGTQAVQVEPCWSLGAVGPDDALRRHDQVDAEIMRLLG